MKVNTGQGLRQLLITAAALACFGVAPVAGASTGGIAWWNYAGTPSISMVSLQDGSGGGTLRIGPIEPSAPSGLAYDPAERRFYWTDVEGPGCDGQIAFASRQGGEGGLLETGDASVCNPRGPAIDFEARRVYWANASNDTISYANLDGSGGGDLETTGATVENPQGVAIDPVSARIYWASRGFDFEPGAISYANLDGSGGGDLNTTGARLEPTGLAIDPVGQRLYWPVSTFGPDSISYANLDGSGGGELNTAGATVGSTHGVAIDPAKRRIYWGDRAAPQAISYARLDGSGGGDLDTGEALVWQPAYPALFNSPPNRFQVGEPSRFGDCRIPFTAPGAGELALAGKGVSGLDYVDRPKTETVKLGLTRSVKRKLARRGWLKVDIEPTYTPLGGNPRTKRSMTLRLVPYPENQRLAKCRVR